MNTAIEVPATRELDQERKYLEELLVKRFNFYIATFGVLGTAFAAAGSAAKDPEWLWAPLTLTAFVSLCFWRALFRTHALIHALIKLMDDDHPLVRARKTVEKDFCLLIVPREANHYIAQWIPGLITMGFAISAIVNFAGTAVLPLVSTSFILVVSIIALLNVMNKSG